MAKPSYGIRVPMLSNGLDTEITIQKNGVGLRPLPVKFVLITIGSFAAMLKVFTSDLVAVGSATQQAVFVILWLLMTILLFFTNKQGQLNIAMLFSLLGYLFTPSNRKLKTRKIDSDAVINMLGLTNIASVANNGVITFTDKSQGLMYRVTGNASVLLFEQDRDSILHRVDTFYRTVEPGVELIFMTLKEPQKVYRQAAEIARKHKSLSVHDKDLTALANHQLAVLRDTVASKFKSVHQYMLLKAENSDMLENAKTTLQTELNQSLMFIRRCTPLSAQDISEQLACVFSNPKIDDNFTKLKN